MSSLELPLSGPVNQLIAPWTALLSPFNNHVSVFTINLGRSSAPKVEEQILDDVGSYGRQLGRLGDALSVLLAHFKPQAPLTEKEQRAIDALKGMLIEIDDIKKSKGREPALRP